MTRRLFIVSLLTFSFVDYCNADKSFRMPLSVLERPFNTSFGPADSYGVRLRNFGDIEYYGKITVGSKNQEFRIVFDTGSTELWIMGPKCRVDKKTGKHCSGHTLYQPHSSSTYKSRTGRFRINYEIGFAGGYYVSDTVSLGTKQNSGLRTPDVVFGVADIIDKQSQNDVIDGVMGLGYPKPGEPDSLINRAVAAKVLDEPIYTIYLTKVGGDEHKAGGEIMFGKVDNERCSPNIQYVPLSSTQYWQFKTDKVMIGGNVIKMDVDTVADSGTSSIVMPRDDFKLFLRAIGLPEHLPGLPYISCKAKFVVDFLINGTKFSLTAQELMVKYPDGCVLEVDVTNWKDDRAWVLGVPFGRTYCNIHDLGQKRIGFSRARTEVKRNQVVGCNGFSCKHPKRKNQLLESQKSRGNVANDWPDDLVPFPNYELDDIE